MSDERPNNSGGAGLPSGWQASTLQGLAADVPNAMTDGPFGSKLKSSHYVDSGVRVIRLGNLGVGVFKDEDRSYIPADYARELARHAVAEGDLLISALAEPVGRCCKVPRSVLPAIVKADCIRFRPSSRILADFLMHWMNSPAGAKNAERHSHGVGRLRINMEEMRGLHVPVAPLPEQERIVAEIETQFTRLDAAMSTLQRAKANLSRARASVLKAAVEGRLVPTEAELARAEGRTYEPTRVLLARILDDRKARWPKGKKYVAAIEPDMKDQPDLPEGWGWATVEQVATDVEYGTSAKCSEDTLGVPVIRMANVVDGRLDLAKLKFLPLDHPEFPDQLLQAGEVLFNRTNSPELVGKTAVYHGRPSPCACASYLIRVRLRAGVAPSYLSATINSPRGRTWVGEVVTQQVGQANVNGSKLKAHTFPLPPMAEQVRIVAEIERRLSVLDQLDDALDLNLARCARLRQSILKRAFEGKLVPQHPVGDPGHVRLDLMDGEVSRAV